MSTRMTSAQGESLLLSVGESLPGQHGSSVPKTIDIKNVTSDQIGIDAQSDAQLTIELWWDNVFKGDQIGEQGGQRCI